MTARQITTCGSTRLPEREIFCNRDESIDALLLRADRSKRLLNEFNRRDFTGAETCSRLFDCSPAENREFRQNYRRFHLIRQRFSRVWNAESREPSAAA